IDLGTGANSIGLSLDATAKLDLTAALRFVDKNNPNLPKFSFGVNLDPNIDPADAFFIVADNLAVTGTAHASNLNFGANVGILAGGVKNGTVSLDAGLNVSFKDPNNDGRLTLAELVETPPGQLVSITPTGALTATLPLQANLNGADLFSAGNLP